MFPKACSHYQNCSQLLHFPCNFWLNSVVQYFMRILALQHEHFLRRVMFNDSTVNSIHIRLVQHLGEKSAKIMNWCLQKQVSPESVDFLDSQNSSKLQSSLLSHHIPSQQIQLVSKKCPLHFYWFLPQTIMVKIAFITLCRLKSS